MKLQHAHETRRRFLATIAIVGAGFAAASAISAAGQTRRGMPPSPPPPAEPQDDAKTAQGLDPQAAKKAQLRRSEKEFREGVDRLYALAGELRDEVTQAPSTGVLSARTYKKMEEIEKLAKELKSKAKG